MTDETSTNHADDDRAPDALAAGLLHAPRTDDDKPGQRWAYRPWVLLLMTLAVAYHGFVLIMHNLPAKGLAKEVHKHVNDYLGGATYMRSTGNTQSWAMFAPNPHRSNMFMKVLVKDEAGEIWNLRHDIYGNREYPYLFYDRMGKINRRLIEEKGYRRHYAAWVCREWEREHGGEGPEEVQFVKMWTQVPPPEKVYKYMGYDPMKLYLNQREEESIRCSTSYHGQIPDEIRARLDLPENKPGRFRDVNVRTWWDNLEAEQRQAERQAQREAAQAPDDDDLAPEDEGAKD